MKQFKMVCYFDGEGHDRCFVVSFRLVPAVVLFCGLRWSNGLNDKFWCSPVFERKAEIRANVDSVYGDFRLFKLSDWTLHVYKEPQTWEDITVELPKRCFNSSCGKPSVQQTLLSFALPSPKISGINILSSLSFHIILYNFFISMFRLANLVLLLMKLFMSLQM